MATTDKTGSEAPAEDEAAETVEAPVPTPTAAPAPAPAPAAPPAPAPSPTPVSGIFVAMRDFKARFEHQTLSFIESEVIDPRVGAALRKMGAPIGVIDRIEETKAAR